MKRLRALALASVLLVTSLVTAGQASAGQVLGTNGAPVPSLQWGSCGSGITEYECATARVPLSYRDPEGPSISLAVGRLPATDQANKLGTIFYNPGGPGGSGRIPPVLTPELHKHFDIVGFDPRGIASSTPLRCFTDPANAGLFDGPFPITERQRADKIRDTSKGTRLCGRNAGPLIDHMSTANVARDMDLLRQALGDDQLSYYGVSYGSHLGTVYANLFPDKVRSLVIDAVLDPVEWTTGGPPPAGRLRPFTYRLGSFDGTQDALEDFLRECRADRRCAFHEPGTDPRQKYYTMLERLREDPVTVDPPDGEPYTATYQVAVQLTQGSLYAGEGGYASLAGSLQELYEATEPGVGTREAHAVSFPKPTRTPAFGGQPYYGTEQGLAVMCADTDNPDNPWSWQRFADAADRRAPGFGSQWTYLSLPCATWPGDDRDRYTGPWDRETANPVLVVGNSLGDPATPYEDAVSTSKRLGNARLLTLEATGHGALGNSACIDSALNSYYLDGTLPGEGTVCRPDVRDPFSAGRSG